MLPSNIALYVGHHAVNKLMLIPNPTIQEIIRNLFPYFKFKIHYQTPVTIKVQKHWVKINPETRLYKTTHEATTHIFNVIYPNQQGKLYYSTTIKSKYGYFLPIPFEKYSLIPRYKS